jgi:hypothetical protein
MLTRSASLDTLNLHASASSLHQEVGAVARHLSTILHTDLVVAVRGLRRASYIAEKETDPAFWETAMGEVKRNSEDGCLNV